METKFICPVSMKCTKKQFNRDLKDELVKMGYISCLNTCNTNNNFISTNFGKECNEFTILSRASVYCNNRYFIDHYNPQLFLALAGMTDNPNGNYGEYWKFNGQNHYDSSDTSIFIQDKLYKQNEMFMNVFCSLIDETGETNGFSDVNYQKFKKPTKGEIINQFTNKNMENKELSKFNLSDLKDGNILIFRNGFKGLFIDKAIYINDKGTYANENNYNSNLQSKISRDLDIIKVLATTIPMIISREYTASVIYKREEKIELTLDEIAKKFNIPIEQLTIKE